MLNDDSFQKLLTELDAGQKQQENSVIKTAEKYDTAVRDIQRRNVELDRFRYLLTLLLVMVKLGVFSHPDPNPLMNVSWFIVFLPAFLLEVILGLFLVVTVVVGTISLVGINGYRGLQRLADIIRARRTK